MSYLSDMLTRTLNKKITLGLVAGADQTTATTLIASISASGRPAITKDNWKYLTKLLNLSEDF